MRPLASVLILVALSGTAVVGQQPDEPESQPEVRRAEQRLQEMRQQIRRQFERIRREALERTPEEQAIDEGLSQALSRSYIGPPKPKPSFFEENALPLGATVLALILGGTWLLLRARGTPAERELRRLRREKARRDRDNQTKAEIDRLRAELGEEPGAPRDAR